MSLWRWLRGTVWPFLYAVGERFVDDEGWVLSGHLSFSGMLALIPFLIFATALTGLVIGPEGGQAVLDQLFLTVPDYVAKTLEPVIIEVASQPAGGLLTVSAFGAIYAASNGVEALRVGFDRAYDVEAYRHIALSWLISVGIVLVGFALFILLAILFVLAPVVFRLFEAWTGTDIPREADLIRYGIGFTVLALTLWGMHWVLPSRRMRGLRIWPGILASMLMWTVAASAFSLYLSYTPYYTLTYGTLAGVVIALLFMYFSGSIVILGAEINAILNHDELARRGARRARRMKPPAVH
ncbi:MAG TPA: YihY/virulence factor BrkB family protein [Paracoccaceae bacterium]|nr:YihY/virulence factor BrkB family protein [Paracoccaceae bacterium]